MINNIRVRMILLAAIVILPTAVLVFYLNASEKSVKEKQQIENLRTTANLFSLEHAQIVENARHLLIALSVTPQVSSANPNICSAYLASLSKKYQRYSNFGVADATGNVYCSANPTPQKTNIAKASFFQQAVKANDFAIGDYRISTITNDAVISFGYPLARGVVYSSVDLSWLNQLNQDLSTDESINTLVLDRNGSVLARDPDPDKWVGKVFHQGALLTAIATVVEGVTQDIGLDGTKRIYAFKKIGELPNSPFIVVGIPSETIFKETEQNFFQRIFILLVVTLISLGLAWWMGGVLIVRQVEAIKKIDILKDDFISIVSHQIRTPLTSIRWFSEFLLNQPKYKLPSKQKNIIIDIHQVASEVVALVGTFLDVSKIESGKIILTREAVDFKLLVDNVIRELKNPLSKKKLKLNLKTPFSAPKVLIDQKLIAHVFLNLIGNAIKYSHKKGIIDVTISQKATNITCEVKDRGIGIPASEKGKIFQKFSRASNALAFSPYGTGLGLYFVKLVVDAHQGRVWYKSNNKGTSFIFSLPINPEVIS